MAAVLVALGLLGLAACSSTPEEDAAAARQPVRVQGTATVLELNQKLGVGRLQTEDGPRDFWWNSRVTLPGSDDMYYQAHEYSRNFPAKEGDVIEYQGIESHGQIYVTHAQRKTPS
jgi:hypothetical protein